jgi:hypothetical protein
MEILPVNGTPVTGDSQRRGNWEATRPRITKSSLLSDLQIHEMNFERFPPNLPAMRLPQASTPSSSSFPAGLRPCRTSAGFCKTKWTPDEDQRLVDSVATNSLGNWALIACSVPGRTGKQCRERWINHLTPTLNTDSWTPIEDSILIQQQRICGNVWSHISAQIPGRSGNDVKNRWNWLCKHGRYQAPHPLPLPPSPPRPPAPPSVASPAQLFAQVIHEPADQEPLFHPRHIMLPLPFNKLF